MVNQKTFLALLAVAACIALCSSAPVTTPPPPASVDETIKTSLEHITDVMMDPTAKMRKSLTCMQVYRSYILI